MFDGINHMIDVPYDFIVCKADNMKALFFKILCSFFIADRLIFTIMIPTVDFDNQLQGQACEVGYEFSYDVLASESDP